MKKSKFDRIDSWSILTIKYANKSITEIQEQPLYKRNGVLQLFLEVFALMKANQGIINVKKRRMAT